MIKKIEISNFKGIGHKVYDVAFPFVIKGYNGYGKTSLIEAFRYGLTSKAPEKMLRKDTEGGYVEITFKDPDETVVKRCYFADKPSKVYVNGKSTTATSANETVRRIFNNITEEQMNILTSVEAFKQLFKGEIGSFFLSLIPEEIDSEKINKLVTLSPLAKDIVDSTFTPTDLNGISDYYKILFAERATQNREVTRLKAKLGDFEILPPEHIKNDADLENYSKLFYALDVKKKAHDKELTAYINELNIYKDAQKKIEVLKEKIAMYPSVKPDAGELEAIKKEITLRRENFSANIKALSSLKSSISMYQKTLDNLDKPVCPISNKLICTTDKTPLKEELSELITQATETITEIEGVQESLKSEIADGEAKVEDFNTRLVAWNERCNAEKRIEDLNKFTAPAPVAPFEGTFPFNYAEEKAQYDKYKSYVNTKEEYESQKTLGDAYEELCNIFAPKGILPSLILNEYCDILNAEVEETAVDLGYVVKFVPEKGLQVRVQPGAKKCEVEYSVLSSGEKLLTSIIIYHCINRLLGCGIMIIDNFNDFDEIVSAQVMELLLNMKENYSLMLVAGTNVE